MEYTALKNDDETIDIISDYFIDFEDHYSRENITLQLKDVVLNNQAIEIFHKQSINKYLCNQTDMMNHYKDASILFREYKSLKEKQQADNYSEDGLVKILQVRIANIDESVSGKPFNILCKIELSIKRLEHEFGKKFKLLFFEDQTQNKEEINIGIVIK
jgi:hypothetical protein